ncbi:Na+/H+ antiporter family protein [Psychrobium sp. 1_MG-2023]|uniref:Na+/H+ antiporter family protein n=1 Tax=Psychrobium sp. 1_MG-2023 TaxID=3062624 RepID=UPI000C31E826|nr:Na+/H+ antiporter NhaC family protein [Psychrobium sp. 1_MG-2023]MDP2561730.1 Na+/H+ antiporter NhaC family protein [Psychrobium sp. 1_MG-2023]PKF59781.1 sodium:proton antiporter [Alteromonadales bacterium alter-6D02]
MNAVVVAVLLMLILSLLRVNVVFALIISALIGGVIGDLTLLNTVTVFKDGLGGGAPIALNYAMLGAFAVAISRSGITDVLANKIISTISQQQTAGHAHNDQGVATPVVMVKASLLSIILLAAISSQNLIPVHIAFIPILIPPLLGVINQLKLDRRMVACVLTFGLTGTYMLLPVGFGQVFLNELLLTNLQNNQLAIEGDQLPFVMAIPVLGMFLGLLVAIFFSYRKSRSYEDKTFHFEQNCISETVQTRYLIIALIAIIFALVAQLYTNSIVVGAICGLTVFVLGGVFKPNESQDIFTKGVQMMGTIGFIMISAAGFAEVMKATGAINDLVSGVSSAVGDNKLVAAVLMLTIGLLITMGIGSSFSTIPIIASIYVPLCQSFDFSVLATAALVGTAAALGDAGSPASDSTLGPTSGLNSDGQHDHIWDSVVPTFIHFNIPLIIFGTIAALIL